MISSFHDSCNQAESSPDDESLRGTVRWMAVELFLSGESKEPVHSKETDVWAFGMVLNVRIAMSITKPFLSFPLGTADEGGAVRSH